MNEQLTEAIRLLSLNSGEFRRMHTVRFEVLRAYVRPGSGLAASGPVP